MSTDVNPSQYGVAVTPSDSTLLTRTNNGVTYTPRAIHVGGAGTIVAEWGDGTSVTFSNAEGVLPIRPTRIKAASTATGIVALY